MFSTRPFSLWLAGSAFLLFCLSVAGMIAAGAPQPSGEDLFWIGPAIGLLRTGQLINPYTQPWIADFGTPYFYVHGPVYFYFLSGWFHLFGVSTASILVFHWLLCCLAGLCLVVFLGRINVPAYVRFLVATLFIFCFGKDLRPEPLACVLAFGALLVWEPQSVGWKTFFSVFLMGLSILTYPLALGFIPPFLLLLSLNEGVPVWQYWKKRLAVTFAAGLAVTGALSIMVNGQIAQFLQVLLMHRNLRATGLPGALPRFWESITEYNEWVLTAPCFLLFGLVAIFACFFRSIDPKVRNLVACCSLAIFLSLLLYPEYARTPGQVLALISVLTFCHSVMHQRLRWMIAVLGVLMIAQLQFLLLLRLWNQNPPSVTNIESVRDRLRATRKRICLDGAVARYVFDYRLPANATSFLYGMAGRDGNSKLPPTCIHDVSLKSEDEVWAASQLVFIVNDGSDAIHGLPAEFYRYEPLRVFGRSFNSIPKQPFNLLIFE
ncbi:MAG TPA: hypothetical protein VK673_04515 [Chthoniobacterales bacterium]|nr:hypothetical protein [Chthoniobacterales bacterium]